LSGQIAGYQTQQDFQHVERFLSSRDILKSENCVDSKGTKDTKFLSLWLSGEDMGEEGRWRNWYTGQGIEYLPWAPGRPYDGGTEYNCLATQVELEDRGASRLVVKNREVKDDECSMKTCVLCQVDRPSVEIHVRGLCPNSPFDDKYLYNIGENGIPILRGTTTSVISYNSTSEMWIWYDRQDKASQAVSKSPQSSLLLGLHKFDFSAVKTNPCMGNLIDIKFSTCKTGEFTCTNGQCIDLERRCDQSVNCKDESDEDGCQMLFMKDNYNKKISAFKFDEKTKQNIPVIVKVSIAVKKIFKIEEVNHVFSIKFRLLMEWYDHRLSYYNLKLQRSSNSLSEEEVKKIWIPYVVFENSEHSDATKSDADTEVLITREGEYTQSSDEITEERNIFLGKGNRITFQQVFTKEFECEYQLQLYPFDTQRCTINLEVREVERELVVIQPEKITNLGSTVLTQYIITNMTLNYTDQVDMTKGIQLVVLLKRRIENALLTTYLPTILILIIVYITNFFKPFFFEAVISVNLTALLVLTTLFISVSGSLPTTAYVKMIDIWLIFAQIIPFFEVLLHTFIDKLRTEEDRDINHHGKTIKVNESDNDKIATEAWKGGVKKQQVGLSMADLMNRDEKKMVNARKQFYQKSNSNQKLVKAGETTAKFLIPLFVFGFTFVYWSYGLSHYLT